MPRWERYWPAARSNSPTPRSSKHLSAAADRSRTVLMTDSCNILVVDDESESLALLTSILASEGYQVRATNSGQLALTSVATWLPHLIVLDIRMPGIDGFEVCRRLKACNETRDIPLMFISAATQVDERVAGFALGAVDYITKPFQREELLARV